MTDITEQYTTSAFLTILLQSISSALPSPQDLPESESESVVKVANPLDNANISTSARNLLLTLHVLFPSQFLPALDILDRRLITRLVQHSTADDEIFTPATSKTSLAFHLVQSAASQQTAGTSRFHDVIAPQYYEVRLLAWNCSCPAFAFAAFPPGVEDAVDARDNGDLNWLETDNDELGLLLRKRARDSLPVCKHLLACVLVERVEALSGFAEEKIVSREEIAGWAAGWGR
jgi:hypothetical protein